MMVRPLLSDWCIALLFYWCHIKNVQKKTACGDAVFFVTAQKAGANGCILFKQRERGVVQPGAAVVGCDRCMKCDRSGNSRMRC
ncbi:MAG TPA: hypothetical protein VG105_08055, partial [Paraburkholderia sp.]|nr:hypothetical protein [Paraburkholderia sp.]